MNEELKNFKNEILGEIKSLRILIGEAETDANDAEVEISNLKDKLDDMQNVISDFVSKIEE